MTERLSLLVLAASVFLLVCAGLLFSGAITARELATPQVVQVREPVFLPAVTVVTVERVITATPGPTQTPGASATSAPTQTPIIEVWFIEVQPTATTTPTATPRPARRDPLGWIVCSGGG